MIRARCCSAVLVGIGLLAAVPAKAELRICNRTSYRMQVALGFAHGANVSTRGWLRLDPGDCKAAGDGADDPELVYVHAKTPPVYGSAPLPQRGDAQFCIRDGDFQFPVARACPLSQQVRFAAAKPSLTEQGAQVNLAEQAGYNETQARLAGIQRLLSLGGYDATPIDGVDGAKTRAALTRFLRERKLDAETTARPDFFETLLEAARHPAGSGLSWCNETEHTVMAALGLVEMGAIVTRGWYRVPAGQCLRPDTPGDPHRFYSYAEAVDADGRTVKRGETPVSWGGPVTLCTRDGRFELSDQKDCAAHGLNPAGFAVIDAGDRPSTVITFNPPNR